MFCRVTLKRLTVASIFPTGDVGGNEDKNPKNVTSKEKFLELQKGLVLITFKIYNLRVELKILNIYRVSN